MKTTFQALIILLYFTSLPISAQQSLDVLFDSLSSKQLFDEPIPNIANPAFLFTEIYLSETQNRETMRYISRRRYFVGPKMTSRARSIIETLSNQDYIGERTSKKMLRLLTIPTSTYRESEYIVDNISFWQYLSEWELSNTSLADQLTSYMQEMITCGLLDSISTETISSKKDLVE